MTVRLRDLPQSQGVYDEETGTLIRQSTIGQFQLCAKRVEYDGQPGHLAMVSEPLAFGTCMHYLAEQDIISGAPRLDLLMNMNEWVDEILREQYDWTIDQVPNPRDFFEKLSIAYRTWRRQVRPNLRGTPLAVEEEWFLELGEGNNGPIWLKGTADVVYPTRLVDFKTSNSKWTQDKADVSIQASLYMALARQALDVKINKFTFWTYYRRSNEWTPYTTTRTSAQIDAALRTAHDYGLQHEAKIYPATPVPESSFVKKRGWYCSARFCGAWNICTAKFLGDGVEEDEEATRSW